ncbi:hypothetical protein B296_00024992, partial [Ensete ventricosum]
WVLVLFRVVITCAAFICRERQQPSRFSPSTGCSVLLSQPRWGRSGCLNSKTTKPLVAGALSLSIHLQILFISPEES